MGERPSAIKSKRMVAIYHNPVMKNDLTKYPSLCIVYKMIIWAVVS
jgi:hypothetical protein